MTKQDKNKEIDPDLELDLPEEMEEPEPVKGLSYQELSKQLDAAETQANKHLEDFLRAQAELQNVLRRSEKDIQNAHKFGSEKLISELLTIVDNFDHTIANTTNIQDESFKSIKEGILLTHKSLLDLLKKFGVTVVDPQAGEPFDVHVQEAISMQKKDNVQPNTILQTLQKGYQLHGRLLRPARVIISS